MEAPSPSREPVPVETDGEARGPPEPSRPHVQGEAGPEVGAHGGYSPPPEEAMPFEVQQPGGGGFWPVLGRPADARGAHAGPRADSPAPMEPGARGDAGAELGGYSPPPEEAMPFEWEQPAGGGGSSQPRSRSERAPGGPAAGVFSAPSLAPRVRSPAYAGCGGSGSPPPEESMPFAFDGAVRGHDSPPPGLPRAPLQIHDGGGGHSAAVAEQSAIVLAPAANEPPRLVPGAIASTSGEAARALPHSVGFSAPMEVPGPQLEIESPPVGVGDAPVNMDSPPIAPDSPPIEVSGAPAAAEQAEGERPPVEGEAAEMEGSSAAPAAAAAAEGDQLPSPGAGAGAGDGDGDRDRDRDRDGDRAPVAAAPEAPDAGAPDAGAAANAPVAPDSPTAPGASPDHPAAAAEPAALADPAVADPASAGADPASAGADPAAPPPVAPRPDVTGADLAAGADADVPPPVAPRPPIAGAGPTARADPAVPPRVARRPDPAPRPVPYASAAWGVPPSCYGPHNAALRVSRAARDAQTARELSARWAGPARRSHSDHRPIVRPDPRFLRPPSPEIQPADPPAAPPARLYRARAYDGGDGGDDPGWASSSDESSEGQWSCLPCGGGENDGDGDRGRSRSRKSKRNVFRQFFEWLLPCCFGKKGKSKRKGAQSGAGGQVSIPMLERSRRQEFPQRLTQQGDSRWHGGQLLDRQLGPERVDFMCSHRLLLLAERARGRGRGRRTTRLPRVGASLRGRGRVLTGGVYR
ncbi:guanine nucleotide-binding protein G(s) subunit alpha isoforms XLas-like [Pipistrellus kuhlii]|uniref:guanine nucleotide-binding protein G(s) subunit alpha isoforms XLas-like n=1 Tax=Pipistrellus kuhlii TaxID=59472 RepID=UPI001E272E86|nr:guanine nucleotide-binding protein G(s) subunit alpha isoforms XLas-like [Pipistrellus kuhlii]